jgi:hypothetical protein
MISSQITSSSRKNQYNQRKKGKNILKKILLQKEPPKQSLKQYTSSLQSFTKLAPLFYRG